MYTRASPHSGTWLRAAALLGVGTLAVHELCYLVGYGDGAGRALAAHGHSYLGVATSLATLLLLVALAMFVARLARGGAHRTPGARLRRIAPAAAGALFAIYSVQEFVEGLVASGHPGGLAGVYGHGGWSAVLFAVAIGLVVAALLCGADAALARVAARCRSATPSRLRAAPLRAGRRAPVVRRLGISQNLAGRAPPLPLA